MSSNAQPASERIKYAIHFLLRQPAELALQLDSGNGLNLLKMKRAGPEERLGDVQFPSVAAQSRGVEQNNDEVQFVGPGFPVSSEAGRTLAAMPKSVNHMSPGFTAGIVLLHAVEHQGTFHRRLVAEGDVIILGCQFREFFAHRPALRFGELRKLIYDLGRTQVANVIEGAGVVRTKIISQRLP